MEITSEQFAQVKPYLPRQRGNVLNQNIAILNAILWLAENDCKWAALPKRFGSWHTVYARVHRWANAGVLDRVFEQMQRLQLIRIKLEVVGAVGAGGAAGSKRMPSVDLTSELPKFAWVPRIRVCHRRLAAARRRSKKSVVARSPALAMQSVSPNFG
jgi:transposase